MLSKVRRLGLSQLTATRSRIIEHLSPTRRVRFAFGGQRAIGIYNVLPNSFLEISDAHIILDD